MRTPIICTAVGSSTSAERGAAMMKLKTMAAVAAFASGLPAMSQANPILQQISPVPANFEFGTDFAYATGTVVADVTALLSPVDLFISPLSPPSSSTSGCEAADFAGFIVGTIALLQRGSCNFDVKVQNAQSAGAVGALIFNEGQVGRTEAFTINCGAGCGIPTLFASFLVGLQLSTTPGAILRISTDLPEAQTSVSEPEALTLLGLGLFGLLFARGRRVTAA